ncbi:MAG: cobalamin biosynthesis protein CobD [Chloroflexi bacterium RBG_13_52_12]|nr:MAG: cobalamin biosynthesis protein CobD [Chloroflexi bacterium RBG_13_52_12]
MEWILIPALAVVIDLALGDPPDVIHPVAWMGKVISLLERVGLKLRPAGQFVYGIVMALFVAALFAVPVYYLVAYLRDLNQVAYIIVAAVLLKLTFSIRGLWRTALKIKSLLREDKLDKTRFELRALVSRNTGDLERPFLASAAVESVAEGTCDSLVAPLFYFLILGVPGAIGYRAVNTLDSMIGYHGKYEHLGKFAARLDDVLNFIPARLAALMLIVAAALQKSGRRAWKTALREHVKTESPNAGWPMAAMAGALGTRMEKVGHYVLGEGNPSPSLETIDSAVKIFLLAAAAWILICLMTGGVRLAVTT